MDCESQGIDITSVPKSQAQTAVAVIVGDYIIYNEENQENMLNKENDYHFHYFISNNCVIQEENFMELLKIMDIKEDIQDRFKDTYINNFFRYNDLNNNDSSFAWKTYQNRIQCWYNGKNNIVYKIKDETKQKMTNFDEKKSEHKNFE